MASSVKQNLADRYYAVVPVPATGMFAPGRNTQDGDVTAGALAVIMVDSTGAASGTSSTATTSSVAPTTAGTQALAANPARRGATFTNSGGAGSIYLLLGSGAVSSANYSALIAPGGNYTLPAGFTGAVQADWTTTAGAGNLLVTELTA